MNLTIKELQNIETEIIKEISEICKENHIDYFLHCGSVLGAIRHGGPIPWDTDVDIIIPYNQYNNFIQTVRKEISGKFYIDYYDDNVSYPELFARVGLKGYSTNILHVDLFKLVGITSNVKKQKLYTRKARFFRVLYMPRKRTEEYFGKMSFKSKFIFRLLSIISLPFSDKWIISRFEKHCGSIPFEKAEFVTNPSGHYGMKNVLPKYYYGKGKYVEYSGIKVKVPEKYHEYLMNYYGDYMKLPSITERKVEPSYKITRVFE